MIHGAWCVVRDAWFVMRNACVKRGAATGDLNIDVSGHNNASELKAMPFQRLVRSSIRPSVQGGRV